MKILITGASGSIGGEVLNHCLEHPRVSTVIAFARRELAVSHPKLQCVTVKDFSVWPDGVLEAHADAVAMIWNIGSYSGSVTADLQYPLAFVESMGKVLEASSSRRRFKFVLLSGKFVRQNQEEKLWVNDKPRKLKGLMETRALEFAASHGAIWETSIVRPGGVVTRRMMTPGVIAAVVGAIAAAFGENWCVFIQELGAFMTYLAVDGEGEEPLIQNARIVRKGRELLQLQKAGSAS